MALGLEWAAGLETASGQSGGPGPPDRVGFTAAGLGQPAANAVALSPMILSVTHDFGRSRRGGACCVRIFISCFPGISCDADPGGALRGTIGKTAKIEKKLPFRTIINRNL